MTASNEIRGGTDAARHLGYLERHDVFLTPLDGTGVETWRHHALVRDHLRQTLERTEPDRWADLHRRAAAHYAPADLERAIGHALTAPDPDFAADLIQRGAGEPGGWTNRVPTEQLLRWLEAMPDRVFTERASTRSLGLSTAARCVRPDLVDRRPGARPPESPAALEELFAQAWRADVAGDMQAVRDACLRAIQMCEPGSLWWLTMHGGLAGAEYMLGHWDAAAESFVAMQRPLFEQSLTSSGGAQHENLRAFPAVIRAMQGETAAAAGALRELREWLAAAEGLGYRSGGIAAWAEAMVAFYVGDLSSALRWDALPDDSAFVDQPLPPMVFRLDLARVRRAAGDSRRAAELLADVRRRLSGFADPGKMQQWVDEEEAALGGSATEHAPPVATPPDRQRGANVEPLSAREREVLRLLCSEFSQPEIAAHLYVSYNTTKTHTRTIYRKLGVTSRSSAVARARALGYL